ncbi:MFS transporter [Streptomyces cuspidosporus]|uniref:MFS transporter n=1 Tax=Streptomyces cuspidosporus TaxID=66882 RepID=A0ABP5U786_9ACTN
MADLGADQLPCALVTEVSKAPGLFSRTHAAATASFAAVMFLTGFAALAVVPTLPTAARDLDGVGLFPVVAGCFVTASLLGGVLGGHWADRAGARRPLAAGVVLTVVTLVVSGGSVSVWQLAAGRLLDGLAAGMVAVSVNAAIGQAYPERLRPRALALMSSCWIIPSLAGPPLAGLVSEWWSWRAVFFGLAALTLLPALALVVVLRGPALAGPEAAPTDDHPSRPPLLVAAVVSLGAALGQYGVSGWDVRHLLFAAAGLGLLAVFAPRLLPVGTWRAARGLPATVLLRALSSGTYFTIEALVPLMLIAERRAPAVVIGLAFTAAAVVWAGASWVQGRLENVPRHLLVAVGALVMAVAVGLAVAGTLARGPYLVAASAMPVAAVGMGLLAPSLTVLSLSHSPSGRLGHTSGAMQTSQNLGQVVVLALSFAVLNTCVAGGASATAGYGAAFGLLLAPTLLIALLAVRARGTGGRVVAAARTDEPSLTGSGSD